VKNEKFRGFWCCSEMEQESPRKSSDAIINNTRRVTINYAGRLSNHSYSKLALLNRRTTIFTRALKK
jgi:hypothetical protein